MFSEKINLQPLSATDRIKNCLTIGGVNPTDKTVAEIIGNEDKKNNASTINNVTPSNSANVDCITANYNTGAGNIQSATQEFSENITPNIEGTPITDSDKGTPADDKLLDPADVSKFNLSPIVDEGKKAIITTEPLNTDTKIAIAAQNTGEHNGDNSDKKADSPNNTLEEIINRIFKPAISNDELNAIKFASKDERRKLHNAIIQLDIRTKGYPLDRRDGIICPHCENGSGRDGTGAILKLKTNKHGVEYVDYFCGKCQEVKGNLINVIMTVNNLSDREGYLKALAIGQKILDADICKINLSTIQQGTDAEISQEEKELIRKDIANAQTCDIPEIYRRGISADTFKKFHCGFIGHWRHPKWRLHNNYIPPTPRLIIPTSERHYLACLLGAYRTDANKKFWKMHAGHKEPFNFDSIIAGVNIIVEGEVDCMSVWQVTFKNVCALGGAQSDKFLSMLNEKFPQCDSRLDVQFIVLLDSDDTGRTEAPLLRDELIKFGYPATCKFLFDEVTKTDANDILIKGGDAALKAKIEEILTTAQIELANEREKILSTPKVDDDNAAHHAGNKNIPDDLIISADLRKKLFGAPNDDLSNSRRIADVFQKELRYISDADKWLTFDGTVWNIGSNARNYPVYPFTARLADILKANARSDKERKIAIAFHNLKRVNPAISYLKNNALITITRKDLNTHKNLLNCLNGVVDLETKKLYPHNPELLLTQKARAEYRPDYYSDIVNKFFCDILPDEPTRRAFLRYLGYCLTGELDYENGLFIFGSGRNGKGATLQTMLYLLNDYATTIPIETILLRYKSRDPNAPTPSFNQLEYRRLAIADEIPAGEKLAADKFKQLTGADKINIRNLHEESRMLDNPMFKTIFSGNHLPEIEDPDDEGLNERLMVIKFEQSFMGNRRDPNLKKKLITPDALNGLLSLLVDNAAQSYKEGLIDSSAMQKAKNDYLQSQDFISDFINEYCVPVPTADIKFSEFLSQLRSFSSNAREMTDRALKDAVTKTLKKKFPNVTKRKKNVIVLSGLGWLGRDSPEYM